MSSAPIEIANRDGLPIRGDLHLPEGASPQRLVLIAHGFKGFKDWGFFPHLAAGLAAAGLAALRFNFARSGVGDDPMAFGRLDLFRENSFSREVADLQDLTESLAGIPELADVETDRFGLLGHSRGGAVAILHAAAEPRVASLATWAAVCRFTRHFSPDALAQWKEQGVLSIPNSRTGQMMPLGGDLYLDLTDRLADLDVCAAEANTSAPHLVVHGTDDELVPVSDGREIEAASGGRAGALYIEGTGHTFGAVHPFAGTTEALEQAISATARHFQQTL